MYRKLYRSKRDEMIAGICGGLGEYYDTDPTLIRLSVVMVGIFTGFLPMIVIYIGAWIIIPEEY